MRQAAFCPLLFLSIHAAFGGQSILATGSGPSVTFPNRVPWTGIGAKNQPMRWELRIHDVGVQWPAVGFFFGPAELFQSIGGNWMIVNVTTEMTRSVGIMSNIRRPM